MPGRFADGGPRPRGRSSAPAAASRARVDGVSLDWRRGRDPRRRRRVRLRQVHPRAGDARPRRARRRGGCARTARRSTASGSLGELRRRVQMIFQDPYQTLNPRQRVAAIVAEPLVVQGVAKGEHDARVSRALEDVGLDPQRFLDRYPHQLSGGQRQRVAIAAALVLEPEGLICDEPVSMLDASVRAQILAVLLELQRRRELALLFITHDLSLAWTLCDRIVVMYLGRVVEQGTAADVIERPQHPYTQALVSAIPVPTPGGRRPARAAQGRASRTPTAVPPGCRFHPRCPKRFEPCDRIDPPLLDAGAPGQRAACLLHDPGAGRRRPMPEALRALARRRPARSAGSSPGPRNAITDVPGVRVGHVPGGERRAHRGDGDRAAVAAGARRGADRQRDGRAHRHGSRSRSRAGSRPPSTSAGRTPSAPSTRRRSLASGRGPEHVVIPIVGECDDGDMADSRTVTAGDVERALEALGARGRRGHGRGRHRDGLLRLPGRHRHRVARWSTGYTRRRAAAVQLRRPRLPRPARGPAGAADARARAARVRASPSA